MLGVGEEQKCCMTDKLRDRRLQAGDVGYLQFKWKWLASSW